MGSRIYIEYTNVMPKLAPYGPTGIMRMETTKDSAEAAQPVRIVIYIDRLGSVCVRRAISGIG